MHEQSETIKRNGKWINVYGRALPKAGQQLPGSQTYASLEEAEAAAKARSKSFDFHVQKFKGNPRTEGLQIDINRLKAEIRKAQKKTAIVSGEADPYIQALPTGKITTRTVGKYFARPIGQEGQEGNMIEQLPVLMDVFKKHMQQLPLQNDVDMNEHHKKLLSTGPFLEAHTRQAIWGAEAAKRLMPFEHDNPEPIQPASPVLMTQLDTTTRQNIKEGASTGNVGQDAQLKALLPDAMSQLPPVASGSNRDIENLKKAGASDPLYSQDEIKRRLGPARSRSKAPIDPNEGMDPELRKAVEAEDMRLKKLKIR